MSVGIQARWLQPDDDVATAVVALRRNAVVPIVAQDKSREIRLLEDIPAGHKFAVQPLAQGLRVRKYGEFIGRLSAAVDTGALVHTHNLTTCAMRDPEEHIRLNDSARAKIIGTGGEIRANVAESPVWDAARRCLYWVNVRGQPAIYMLEIDHQRQTSWPMPEDIGSVVLAEDSTLVAAMRSGIAVFNPDRGVLTPIFDPEPGQNANRLNDSKCDANGRLWFGSMRPDSASADGSLYVLAEGGVCRRVASDFVTPNGHAWSLDGTTMFVSDTRRGYIYAHEFDPQSGEAGPSRIFADVGMFPGGPDGATLDSEGYLWSALFNAGCLVRYAPSGAIDRIVRLPVSRPTSCAFGGDGCSTLYVTTASRGLSEARLRTEPAAGHVLALDVGVSGFPPARYKGDLRRFSSKERKCV